MTWVGWFLILSAVLWAFIFAAAWWHSQPRRSFRDELRRIVGGPT